MSTFIDDAFSNLSRVSGNLSRVREFTHPAVTAPLQDSRLRTLAQALTILVTLASGLALAFLTPRMAPIQEGSPIQFWWCASGVRLGPGILEPFAQDAHLVEGWASYELGGLHGTRIYRVPFKDLLPYFDRVVESLERHLEDGKNGYAVRGYAKWRELQFANEADVEHRATTLIALQREALYERLRERSKAEGWESTFHADEQMFLTRWHRAKSYWANVVFEAGLFLGLAYFIAWPVLRSRSPIRWAIHVALSPVLFLLPAFLGYATTSLTSAGPSGGILYPFVISHLRDGSMNHADKWLLERLPQILEPLSPSIGSPTAITGFGMPGPTLAMLCGFVLGACVLGVSAWIRGEDHKRTSVLNESCDVAVPAEADPRPAN